MIADAVILQAVMVNASRDHVTSVDLTGQRGAVARRLFVAMVTVARTQFCVRYCRERGLGEQEERAYLRLLGDTRKELAALLTQPG